MEAGRGWGRMVATQAMGLVAMETASRVRVLGWSREDLLANQHEGQHGGFLPRVWTGGVDVTKTGRAWAAG